MLAFLGLAIGTVAYFLGRRDWRPDLETETEVIDLRAKVKKKIADRDAESARAWVEAEYRETIKNLDTTEAARVDQLRRDPVRLAELLYRTAHGDG